MLGPALPNLPGAQHLMCAQRPRAALAVWKEMKVRGARSKDSRCAVLRPTLPYSVSGAFAFVTFRSSVGGATGFGSRNPAKSGL